MSINISQSEIKKYDPEMEAKEEKRSLIKKIDDYLAKFSRVPLKERLFFVQHLSVMLKSGISISIALKTLAQQTDNKFFRKIINDIAGQVEKGKNFSESLLPYKKIFGELFISMIEAGETSGKLENVLNELFIQMKKEHKLISKIKGALTYPIVIITAMIGIGIFMIVVIVPKITNMFTEMNATLPLATRILIKVSETLIHHGLIASISFILLILLFIKILKTKKGKFLFQSLTLRMPIIAPIIKKINLARFARNISSLLKTDIMIIKTFQITANCLGNLHYQKAIIEMSQKIKKGGRLNEAISAYGNLFPPIVTQMIAIGEETGELDNILVELAEFYEEDIDQIMENLPSIIEPLLILALGIGIGGMAVAIIMPMYTIGQAI